MGPTHQYEVLCVHLPRPLLRVVICAEEWTVCAAPGSQVGQFITVLGHFFLTLLHGDRKSTRLNSSHVAISYAVFCLKKKKRRRAPTASISKESPAIPAQVEMLTRRPRS